MCPKTHCENFIAARCAPLAKQQQLCHCVNAYCYTVRCVTPKKTHYDRVSLWKDCRALNYDWLVSRERSQSALTVTTIVVCLCAYMIYRSHSLSRCITWHALRVVNVGYGWLKHTTFANVVRKVGTFVSTKYGCDNRVPLPARCGFHSDSEDFCQNTRV